MFRAPEWLSWSLRDVVVLGLVLFAAFVVFCFVADACRGVRGGRQ
jgi:hypothetical protein